MRTQGKLSELFGTRRPLVGMVHLLPLPGAPRYQGSMDAVLERAVSDARALVAGGMDGVLVENFLDAPFFPHRVPPETVAALAVAVREVRAVAPVPVGVNVLRNDGAAALSIAAATGAAFVRVNVLTGAMLTDQGWIEGEAHELMRLRARLGAPTALLADVLVKHATPPPGVDLASTARDTWERGLADGLIVSGVATGLAIDPARLAVLRTAVPEAPLWIGSGLTTGNAGDLLPMCDGAIVGTALMHESKAGHGVDPARVEALVEAARAVRGT